MKKIPVSWRYFPYYKDIRKINLCTKFIGKGSPKSLITVYEKAFGVLANPGFYSSDDLVFIGTEDELYHQAPPYYKEIEKAISAKASFLIDSWQNRMLNKYEHQVAEFLKSHGYREQDLERYSIFLP